jgi:CBS domain-containing protein
MHDIDEFLRRYAPFDELADEAREEFARATEVEFFVAGTTVFREGEGPVEHVRVIRKGAIELVADGAVLDVLGEGELFGLPSMLAGLPAWFEARAGEDTLCYRLPTDLLLPLFGRPAGLRYVARTLIERPERAPELSSRSDQSLEPVARLVLPPAIICEPQTSVREVARRMADAEQSAAVVRLANGDLGIVTDRDLRDRVVAGSAGPDAPVAEVMTAPAITVSPARTQAEVMLEMLDEDVHHIPVAWPHGEVLGVVSDRDLLVAEARTPLALRREISEAADPSELRQVTRRLRSTIVAFHDDQVPPSRIAAIISVVTDAITSRLLELGIGELGSPPGALAWMALGSIGRREGVPSSDIESGLVWDHAERERGEAYMQSLATEVVGHLGEGGFTVDTHGVTAARPVLDRSFESWRAAIRSVIEDPEQEQGLIFISLLADARRSFEHGDPRDPLEELAEVRHRRTLLRLLLRLALANRPPTGLRRLKAAISESGDARGQRGQIDIKRAGLLPIVGLARYASLAAGSRAIATRERLQVAATAGTLDAGDARTLTEAFDLFWRLRLEHQVEQLREGIEPDDLIEVARLSPITRGYIREAFHAVADVQRALRGELELPP